MCGLRATGCGLRATGYGLRATGCGLRATGFGKNHADRRMARRLQPKVGMSRDPKKLEVFHKAHQLALDVYQLTDGLPPAERYGMSAQLRRAATSVPTNIVEGAMRSSQREYQRFIDVALASAAEVQYLLDLAVDLGFVSAERSADCRDCARRVVRELQNLLKAIGQFPA